MGDNAVMPSFTRTYTIKKEQTRHEFTLPIPAGAQTGIYKMKLHTASPVSSADSQLLLEIQ